MHKTTDLPDGSGLVHHFEGMTRDKRPKDPTRRGTLQFAVLDHNGLDLSRCNPWYPSPVPA